MAATRDERLPVSWNDLLAAISPQRGFSNTDLPRAIGALIAARQEDRLTDAEAAELIKMLVAVAVSGEVNAIVDNFSRPTPRDDWEATLMLDPPGTVAAFQSNRGGDGMTINKDEPQRDPDVAPPVTASDDTVSEYRGDDNGDSNEGEIITRRISTIMSSMMLGNMGNPIASRVTEQHITDIIGIADRGRSVSTTTAKNLAAGLLRWS